MRYNILILLIAVSTVSLAQENVKEFYSEYGLRVKENRSYYYLVGTKIIVSPLDQGTYHGDTVYTGSVKAYYTKSQKLKSALIFKKGMLQGDYVEYHENGAEKEKGVYFEDRKSGTVTGWHSNGQVQKVLRYYTVDKEYGWKDLKFDIVDYWDSLGNQLVQSGNGNCVCSFDDQMLLREEGKVVNGKKEQTWKAFSDDTLKYEEKYNNGDLLQGLSYHEGNLYAYKAVEEQAEMKGGIPALMKFLQKNIQYPGEAKRKGKEGKVFVKFIVDRDGNIIDPEIAKGVYRSLDDEALRVVKLLKKWTPGKQRGIPVKSQFVLPINFKLG